jgi:putative transposase
MLFQPTLTVNIFAFVICVQTIDITYIPLQQGVMYLVAVIDWFSRYVLAWQLSHTLPGKSCLEALELALSRGKPEIFNTDKVLSSQLRCLQGV